MPGDREKPLRELLDAHNRRQKRTFDERHAELEAFCRQVVDAWRAGGWESDLSKPIPPHDESTPVWRAKRILIAIAEAREARDRRDVEGVASQQADIVALAAEPALRRGLAHSLTQSRVGKYRRRTKETAALLDDIDALRANNPTRQPGEMAAILLRRPQRRYGPLVIDDTNRTKAVSALRRRIERALANTSRQKVGR
jgi:hypothetical protein